jgi:glycosyltransferase involved in cell wall biosynthesis
MWRGKIGSFAPLEAMALGCPTVYTKRGSGPELIRDGRDGLLVEPSRPEEIADSIVRLLTDDDLARRLGSNGRDRVIRSFSLRRVAKKNEAFFQACIEAFKSSHSNGRKLPVGWRPDLSN